MPMKQTAEPEPENPSQIRMRKNGWRVQGTVRRKKVSDHWVTQGDLFKLKV